MIHRQIDWLILTRTVGHCKSFFSCQLKVAPSLLVASFRAQCPSQFCIYTAQHRRPCLLPDTKYTLTAPHLPLWPLTSLTKKPAVLMGVLLHVCVCNVWLSWVLKKSLFLSLSITLVSLSFCTFHDSLSFIFFIFFSYQTHNWSKKGNTKWKLLH